MRVLAHSPHESDEGRRIGTYVDLDTLLRESDVISLHCPLTKDNAELINRQTIAKMKDGALLVNNARGQLLNEQDVADALNSGKLAGAALDVVSAEPVHADNPLLSAKNCILTPHISWAPLESRRASWISRLQISRRSSTVRRRTLSTSEIGGLYEINCC